MQYRSTRSGLCCTSMEAIRAGIAPDGGLYLPDRIPRFSSAPEGDYMQVAKAVLTPFLPDFELNETIDKAYSRFRHSDIAPVVPVVKTAKAGLSVLELFHGPTCAFKDIALQLLPHLMIQAIGSETTGAKKAFILVATSGDTGKAALEGFRDVADTRIVVFYPQNGVSETQRLQMVTQEGDNCHVMAVSGNFDDAQTGVKGLFGDVALQGLLAEKGFCFSSANSINWGRLAPQIAYYWHAAKHFDGVFNVVVPTGNFGNILAAWYAKKMGAPIGRLICASNANRVLTDFLSSGVYDRRRELHMTHSPSMDILISSNLERLLFEICDRDAERVGLFMSGLRERGYYEVNGDALKSMRAEFYGGMADDEQTRDVIGRVWRERGYLLDPHTAVGWKVWEDYMRESGDERAALLVATASPYKFAPVVWKALGGGDMDEESMGARLEDMTGVEMPMPLKGLNKLIQRHDGVCAPDGMGAEVERILEKL